MIKQLASLANHLDAKGLTKEADYLDALIKEAAGSSDGMNLHYYKGKDGWSAPRHYQHIMGRDADLESLIPPYTTVKLNELGLSVFKEEYGDLEMKQQEWSKPSPHWEGEVVGLRQNRDDLSYKYMVDFRLTTPNLTYLWISDKHITPVLNPLEDGILTGDELIEMGEKMLENEAGYGDK